jgi:hypothetical protein
MEPSGSLKRCMIGVLARKRVHPAQHPDGGFVLPNATPIFVANSGGSRSPNVHNGICSPFNHMPKTIGTCTPAPMQNGAE